MSTTARLLLHSSLLLGVATASPLDAQSGRGPAPQLRIAERNETAAAEAAHGAARTGVRPGDVIRYTLTLTNPGSAPVQKVTISDPIPAGVRLVVGSTQASRPDARLEFSADGGRTWSAEPRETVTENGVGVERAVPADRYTNVRWVFTGSVAPRTGVTADFSARVAGGA